MTRSFSTDTILIPRSGLSMNTTNAVASEPMSNQHVVDGTIVKIDDEKRQVFGWASIIKDEGGKILLDRQNDFIDSEDELEKAAYDYVLKSRDGGEMHVRRGVSKMIESVVFTEEKQRAMGIPAGSMPTGWWIGFQVNDERVWQQVKKGDYAGFSVHGTGKRETAEVPMSEVTEIGKSAKHKKKNKVSTVMHEFKAGKLKSSTGQKVTDPKQAMAIAISEQKRAKMKKISVSDITKKTEALSKREFSTKQRSAMAEEGTAMPDGSFPIKSRGDVQNALQSIGRAKDREAVLRHIRRRCKDLGCEDMLPDWAVSKSTEDLVRALSVLLADTVSVYHEAHGFHWNVKGQNFSQYHALFESIYSDLYGSIDPIAENILKLGMDAPFQLSQFIGLRTISESQPANDPQSMASELLDCIDQLIDTLNMAFDSATAENQQGIANFIAERIDATQKWAWQLRSSVGLQKGDRAGHEFHGNQYVSGKGGRNTNRDGLGMPRNKKTAAPKSLITTSQRLANASERKALKRSGTTKQKQAYDDVIFRGLPRGSKGAVDMRLVHRRHAEGMKAARKAGYKG